MILLHNPLIKLGDCAMAGPYKEAARRLYETAQSQQGFFTTKQAMRAGFAEKTHAYHVKVGNWIREHRGIYRLADFPTAESARRERARALATGSRLLHSRCRMPARLPPSHSSP